MCFWHFFWLFGVRPFPRSVNYVFLHFFDFFMSEEYQSWPSEAMAVQYRIADSPMAGRRGGRLWISYAIMLFDIISYVIICCGRGEAMASTFGSTLDGNNWRNVNFEKWHYLFNWKLMTIVYRENRSEILYNLAVLLNAERKSLDFPQK